MARDGRPFDMASGYWQDILIDYDHQTLQTDQNVQPVSALTPESRVGASSLFVILGEVAAIELA
ncbi:hypothetical protein [Aeromonas hydrophila]|nr:hypothetical protein [Aeromonas hydrophila]